MNLDRSSQSARAAVFLDRDGVLIEDRGLVTHAEELHLVAGVAEALQLLKTAGFRLIVVSNQAVVARGLISEEQLQQIDDAMARMLRAAGAPPLDAVYYCPHHPNATLPAYRVECECRKPRPGALLRAAREHKIDLAASFTVGDRITDIIAGAAAGCRTVLVRSAVTDAPPIVTVDPIDESIRPDYVCPDLQSAAAWILEAI
jgi:D-glycero-D-manno-heptose 1,7-bisphosphate phosphatase